MKESVGLTIGRLARAAHVGIETIRYYQRRGLLPTPDAVDSTFRLYSPELIERIQFIKRAQELGFSLEEVLTFLQLEDGADRKAIREVAVARLDEIRTRIADLQKMEEVLARLIHQCETSGRATLPYHRSTVRQLRNQMQLLFKLSETRENHACVLSEQAFLRFSYSPQMDPVVDNRLPYIYHDGVNP